MKQTTQSKVAVAIGAPAAIVVAASIALLIAEHLDARRREPINKARIETLQQTARQDVSRAPALHEEYQRQAAESLERADRRSVETGVLVVGAVVFLLCGKWLISLAGHYEGEATLLSKTVSSAEKSGALHELETSARRLSQQKPPGDSGGEAEIDLSRVDALVAEHGRGPEAAIPILQAIQTHYRYLPDEALKRVCDLTEITPAQIAGVSTFYAAFRRSPVGRHVVKVCHGTACHVAGAAQITDEIRRHLRIAPEADTDPERMFTVDQVACLGCCSLAPVIMIDETTAGVLTPVGACEAIEAARQEQPV